MNVPKADSDVRGVFRECDTFPGFESLRAIDSHGRLQIAVMVPDAHAEAVIEFLESWLDQHDPPAPALRIVATDASPSRRPKSRKAAPPTLTIC